MAGAVIPMRQTAAPGTQFERQRPPVRAYLSPLDIATCVTDPHCGALERVRGLLKA